MEKLLITQNGQIIINVQSISMIELCATSLTAVLNDQKTPIALGVFNTEETAREVQKKLLAWLIMKDPLYQIFTIPLYDGTPGKNLI